MTGRQRSVPAKVTAGSLENIAASYLERFASSTANLRRVLMRRIRRAAEHHGDDPAEGAALVEALIVRFQQAGILDDRRYAAAKAGSLHRRGGSRRAIASRLAQHGVAAELIAGALQDLRCETGNGDVVAACAFIRRRRLGAYRAGNARAASRVKDMAALARAGFSLEVARKVLACVDSAAVESLLGEES